MNNYKEAFEKTKLAGVIAAGALRRLETHFLRSAVLILQRKVLGLQVSVGINTRLDTSPLIQHQSVSSVGLPLDVEAAIAGNAIFEVDAAAGLIRAEVLSSTSLCRHPIHRVDDESVGVTRIC